jgi:hypothetical protein
MRRVYLPKDARSSPSEKVSVMNELIADKNPAKRWSSKKLSPTKD